MSVVGPLIAVGNWMLAEAKSVPSMPGAHAVKNVRALSVGKTAKPEDGAKTPFRASAVHWPAPANGTATVGGTMTAAATGNSSSGRAKIAGTPVWAQAVTGGQAPQQVAVQVADQDAAARAGVQGVLFTATQGRADQPVRIGVDYADFAQAYGGNYAQALRLVQLPACALTTPDVPSCRVQTPLRESANDTAGRSVYATLDPAAAPSAPAHQAAPAGFAQPASFATPTTATTGATVLAVTAGTTTGDGGGPGGTYGATTLSPSGSWSAGGSSGSFNYSYPLQVPPAASDLVPSLGLSYSSASVDGQTASTQAQANWLGDGWSTPLSYVEQSFKTCADSPEGTASPQATQDECYDGPVLTLSLDGSSTQLVYDAAKKTYVPANANGDVVQRVTGANNGSGTHDQDYWQVTDRTGKVYQFGRNQLPGWSAGKPTTNSVDTQPVYSAHSGDPCYNATWTSSWCTMAFRWNLDYVTDVHGNAMAYYYKQDTNAYAQNNKTTSAASYVRDSHLDHIDYGFSDLNAYSVNGGHAPNQVLFTTGDRCASTTPCGPLSKTTASSWPDVPQYLVCTAGSSCQIASPSRFSTVRLTGIATQQWNGTAYQPVDSWAFDNATMPASGDNTSPTLWLASITRTGKDTTAGGSAVPLPPMTFTATTQALPNRADTTQWSLPPMLRHRIGSVTTETGSVISVTYGQSDPCTSPVTIAPATNTSDCYPVYWTPPGDASQYLDWFNKWLVTQVTQSDPTGGAPTMSSTYKYLGGAAWAYDDGELVKAKYRTYGQYRGYGHTQTFTGQGNDPLTEAEQYYYRGMSHNNGRPAVLLTDSQGGQHEDLAQLAGSVLESVSYDYQGGPLEGSTINSYWVSPAVATRSRSTAGLPDLTANAVAQVESWTRGALTDPTTHQVTWRKTETDISYDTDTSSPTFGLPIAQYAHGDLSDPTQRRCTTTKYTAPNTSANLTDLISEVETDALACGGSNPGGATVPGAGQLNALTAPATVSRPGDVVSDVQTFYDNPGLAASWPQPADSTVAGMLGQAPVHGNVSEQRIRSSYSGGSQWQVTSATVWDDDSTNPLFYPVGLGRATDVYDAMGNKTHSDYTTSSVNGLTTGVTTTNPLGQVTAMTIDTARGLPVTTTDENTWANNVKNKTSKVTSTLQHDGLGRTTAVWTNERPTTAPANAKYTYQISNSAPTVVTTQTMNDSLGYITSTGIFDALMRQRQTQRETPQGGRMVTDNYYDTHGWLWKTNGDYWDPATTPNGTLVSDGTKPGVTDATMPVQSVRAFDGHGRPVLVTSYGLGQVKEQSATQYDILAAGGGDKTISAQLDPVSGQPFTGSPVRATVQDALGRTTELDDYTTLPSVTVTQPTGTVPVTTVAFSGGGTTAGNGNQQVIQYGYDNLGRQNDVHNLAVDQHWRTTYNMLGRPLTKQDPDAGSTTNMLYDAAGRLLQSTDANTNTLSYTYDQLGRKTAEFAAPVSGQAPANQTAAWSYDNSNGVAGVTNPIGHLTTSTAFGAGGNTTGAPQYTTQAKGFNVFGEATGQTVTIPSNEGALAGSYSFSQLYSANTGLPTTTIYPATPNGSLPQEGVTTGYKSKLDLPASLTGSVQYSVDTSYTAYAQVGQIELGTNTVNAYLTNTYDSHTGALTDTKLANTNVSPTPIDETSYQYDAAGNPVSQTEVRGGSSTETQCFGYDTLARLHQAWTTASTASSCATDPSTNAGATVASGTGGAYWTSWELDPLGRRSTETDHGLGGAADSTTAYVYNYSGNGTVQPDALTSATTTSGPSTVSSTSFAFDAVGNNTQRVTTVGNQSTTSNLSWTPQGKLSGVNATTGGPSYVYDSDGSLLLQKDPGQTVLYLPGEQLSLANGTVSTTRFYSVPGGGLAVRTSATSYSFQTGDRHGTVGLTIDPAFATPVWRQQTPYGAPRGTAPSNWPDNLGFLNKAQDTGTGLTMVGARWYDPVLGQFASLDPVFEATDAQQQNGYGYAGANPISSSDPTGLARGCADDPGGCQVDASNNSDGSCPMNHVCPSDTVSGSGGKDNGPDSYNPAPIPPPPPPVKHPSCDWLCSGLGWVEKHAAPVVATVAAVAVGAGCMALTGGAGSIGCAAAAGAVYNVTDYAMSTPPSQWSAGAMLKTAVKGAVIGAACEFGLGLAAAVARPLLRPLGRMLAPLARAAAERGGALVESLGGLAKNIGRSTNPRCFVAGTKVAVEGGSKNIESIKVGDKVWSEDPVTGKRVLKTVTRLFQHQAPSLVVLTLAGHQLKVTPNHVLWVTGRGWIEAGQVKPGDHMIGFDGEPETVDSVGTEDTPTTVYNFEVADTHTYFVLAGEKPVLVHNACPLSYEEASAKANQALGDAIDHMHNTMTRTKIRDYAMGSAAVDRVSGAVAVAFKRSGDGADFCAEDLCRDALVAKGANPADIVYSIPRRPLKGTPEDVCVRCEGRTDRGQFAPGTTWQSDRE